MALNKVLVIQLYAYIILEKGEPFLYFPSLSCSSSANTCEWCFFSSGPTLKISPVMFVWSVLGSLACPNVVQAYESRMEKTRNSSSFVGVFLCVLFCFVLVCLFVFLQSIAPSLCSALVSKVIWGRMEGA